MTLGKENISPLDRIGWLSQQGSDLRDWVIRSGRWRMLDSGQDLYDAGDAADGLFGLAEGGLELSMPLTDGEPVTIYRAEAGFWIGDSALLADQPRLVSITAVIRSRVFYVPGSAVRARLDRVPGDWKSFYALSHANLARLLDALGEALALSPRARVARQLMRLADAEGAVEVSQADLARLIGVRRATLQRALGEMADHGWIESGYRHLLVRDRRALERLSQEA